jgi:hypothetical protein
LVGSTQTFFLDADRNKARTCFSVHFLFAPSRQNGGVVMIKTLMLIFFFVSALGFTGCTSRPALRDFESVPDISGSIGEDRRPKLILEAYPRVGFAPLRVSIKAQLQNVPENDPVFACIWESWSFGDGAVSSEKTGCDGAAIVEMQYLSEHIYRHEGLYEVRFILGDNQVLSNPVQVRVIGDSF